MPRQKLGKPAEIFLSHSSKDRTFADRLVNVFLTNAIPVFYSKKSILGAQQWHDEIGAALKRCDWFVLILSPQSVKSDWVKRELLYTLQSKTYKNRIVPILHKRSDLELLSWTLSALQQIDFTSDYHQGCRELLALWGMAYTPAATVRASRRRKR